MNPYEIIEVGIGYQVRRFNVNVDPEELLWHRDKEDRLIEVLSGSGWYLQKENLLPEKLKINENYFIRNREWHRIIKGIDDLIIKIKFIENKNENNKKTTY